VGCRRRTSSGNRSGCPKRRSLCLQQPPPVVSMLSTAVLQQSEYAPLNFQCQLTVQRACKKSGQFWHKSFHRKVIAATGLWVVFSVGVRQRASCALQRSAGSTRSPASRFPSRPSRQAWRQGILPEDCQPGGAQQSAIRKFAVNVRRGE
jgi:hypothetical protein